MSPDPASKPPGQGPWSFPSWRRIGDFFVTLTQLERAYQSLKSEQGRLREDVERIARLVEDHNGQLKVLTTFVQAALRERSEINVEKAVAREIERLTDKRSLSPGEDR